MTERYYPPEWCGAETMAYLLDMGTSTFRAAVARGDLPEGHGFGGLVRWHRDRTLAAFEGRAVTPLKSAPVPSNDNIDPILSGITSYGTTKKIGRQPAATRS